MSGSEPVRSSSTPPELESLRSNNVFAFSASPSVAAYSTLAFEPVHDKTATFYPNGTNGVTSPMSGTGSNGDGGTANSLASVPSLPPTALATATASSDLAVPLTVSMPAAFDLSMYYSYLPMGFPSTLPTVMSLTGDPNHHAAATLGSMYPSMAAQQSLALSPGLRPTDPFSLSFSTVPQQYPRSPAVCKYYAFGYCARGDHCNFAHIRVDENGTPTLAAPHQQSMANNHHSHRNHNQQYSGNGMRGGRGGGGRFHTPNRRNNHGNHSNHSHYNHSNNFRSPIPIHSPPQTLSQSHPQYPYQQQFQQYQPQLQYPNLYMQQFAGAGAGNEYLSSPSTLSVSDPNLLASSLASLSLTPTSAVSHDGSVSHSQQPSDVALLGLSFGLSSNVTVSDLKGRVSALSTDQFGCRLLQRLLDDADRTDILELVYEECLPHLKELMTQAFSNYLIQKLIEKISEKQRLTILQMIRHHLIFIAQSLHGTRAVQKLIESMTSDSEIAELQASVRDSIVSLVKDVNGNHVIQRILTHFTSANNQFIYDCIAEHCVEVSVHKHGCCVIQRCLDYGNPRQQRQLLTEIVNYSLVLVQNEYGNYVVQYGLSIDQFIIGEIVERIRPELTMLVCQKFASNVIEKMIELGNDDTRNTIIQTLIDGNTATATSNESDGGGGGGGGSESLTRILHDQYGNYVIQKFITVSSRLHLIKLVDLIQPHFNELKMTTSGKRIYAKLMKKLGNGEYVSNYASQSASNSTSASSTPNFGPTANISGSFIQAANQLNYVER